MPRGTGCSAPASSSAPSTRRSAWRTARRCGGERQGRLAPVARLDRRTGACAAARPAPARPATGASAANDRRGDRRVGARLRPRARTGELLKAASTDTTQEQLDWINTSVHWALRTAAGGQPDGRRHMDEDALVAHIASNLRAGLAPALRNSAVALGTELFRRGPEPAAGHA